MFPENSEYVWRPEASWIAHSHLQEFITRRGLRDLDHLLEKAAADPAWFWQAVVQDLGIVWREPYRQVLDDSAGKAWARWFPGGRLNITETALDRHMGTSRAGQPALLWEGEDGSTRSVRYRELLEETNRLAATFRSLGLEPGDRVGVYLPMLPETVISLLACARFGAVFVPIFSGYGAEAVATRLRDSGARLLMTADGFYRRGREVPMKEVADAAAAASPAVEHLLVVRRLGREIPWQPGRDVDYAQATAGAPGDGAAEIVDAQHPLMIIYTSGTTGRPKGAVHVHPGFPVKAAQDLAHCFDLKAGDVLFWFTDMGWMMGPWEVWGAAILGATLFIYEGTPDYPDPGRLWQLIERHRVTHFGISPTAIRALMTQGPAWVQAHDLSSLRVLGSTGEPWNPEPWKWFFEHVGRFRCPIINYSGGTEISGGILSGLPLRPIKPASFSGPVPGMAADVVDEEGRPVRGSVGELVIRQPWVGMTQGFWQDRERYLETYWSRWPGIWLHGDFAEIDEEGYWFIHGRSDDTLKIAGKRVGPAEVESALVSHPAVREAAAVGVPHPVKGETLVCFAIPVDPGLLDTTPSGLLSELRDHVADRLGKALRPEAVYLVPDLPRTRNAKIMRRVARAAYLGQNPGDLSALENPASLEAIARLGETGGSGEGGEASPQKDRPGSGRTAQGHP